MNYNRLDQSCTSPDPLQGQTTLPEQDALIRPDPASRQDTVPLRDPLPGRFDLSFTLLPFLCFFALAGAMFFFPEKPVPSLHKPVSFSETRSDPSI